MNSISLLFSLFSFWTWMSLYISCIAIAHVQWSDRREKIKSSNEYETEEELGNNLWAKCVGREITSRQYIRTS